MSSTRRYRDHIGQQAVTRRQDTHGVRMLETGLRYGAEPSAKIG